MWLNMNCLCAIYIYIDWNQRTFFAQMTSFVVRYYVICLLYTSDAADEEDSVDLGGRRIIKKKK